MMETEVKISDLLDVAAEAKKNCVDREHSLKVMEKGFANYVTEVDMNVQKFIEKKLKDLYPSIQFMGEEKNNDHIDFTKPVWILDPVDGTSNLIHDLRNSVISLALYSGQELVMGVVCHLFADEIYYAQKGKGAYLNGRPIHVSSTEEFSRSLVSIGTSPYFKDLADENFETFKIIFQNCEDIRRIGSAALDLAYVAAGRLETYLEKRLNPWDFAAGVLLVLEAGGSVTDFGGKPVDVTKVSDIFAGNGIVDKKIRTELLNWE
ncbi:MAG: inositol monophosphatase family protein [Ruminococcus sp.]|jgi:myo-inositol-1(or 4)-monophosphatase